MHPQCVNGKLNSTHMVQYVKMLTMQFIWLTWEQYISNNMQINSSYKLENEKYQCP